MALILHYNVYSGWGDRYDTFSSVFLFQISIFSQSINKLKSKCLKCLRRGPCSTYFVPHTTVAFRQRYLKNKVWKRPHNFRRHCSSVLGCIRCFSWLEKRTPEHLNNTTKDTQCYLWLCSIFPFHLTALVTRALDT